MTDGIYSVSSLSAKIKHLYDNGLEGGKSTGWLEVSQLYTVREGEMTILTGIPGHGKSAWLDALMVHLARSQGWNFAIFSPENFPLERHIAKVMEIKMGKPFARGFANRIDEDELGKTQHWMDEHFRFIAPPEDALTLDSILAIALKAHKAKKLHGMVIDPWNEIDHAVRGRAGFSETEYISESLTKIRRFARVNQVHIWVVAHPAKMKKDDDGQYPVPTPYDISGSAHWRNKADNAIAIWRDVTEKDTAVQVHIQKVRFRECGRVGMARLSYDVKTGRYKDWSEGGRHES